MRNDFVDLAVHFGAVFRWTRDDQRGTRFIDENGVNLLLALMKGFRDAAGNALALIFGSLIGDINGAITIEKNCWY
jgi:hypothetical protein